MAEITTVRVPMEVVNDTTVDLVHRYVPEGAVVQIGQALADLETSKAVVEVAAPASGPVHWAVSLGEAVAVGGILCYIGGVPEAKHAAAEARDREASKAPEVAGTRFSKKALELLEKHGMDPAFFAGRALVRAEDVEHVLRGSHGVRTATEAGALHPGFQSLVLSGVTLPSGWEDRGSGRLDPAFLGSLKKNPQSFARLSSGEKCEAYRRHGAAIGKDVKLGAGAILTAPQIVLGDGVALGDGCDIQCRERFIAGALTSFGPDLSVRGGAIVLGANVYGGKSVEIGGGGHADPWSLLSVGDTTFIGDEVFINVCRPVVIGREVFLTQRSILVTHNIGHSVLEGYENRFAPIVLEDFAQVGMNCTLYAGSRVGRNAIVVSNSYVISAIPEGKLAMGVPARVAREASRPLDRPKQLAVARRMVDEFAELLVAKGFRLSREGDHSGFLVEENGKRYLLRFREDAQGAETPGECDEAVLWAFSSEHAPPGWSTMDLLAKRVSGPDGRFVNSAREFLRKRGIRLQPGPWRYRGGLL